MCVSSVVCVCVCVCGVFVRLWCVFVRLWRVCARLCVCVRQWCGCVPVCVRLCASVVHACCVHSKTAAELNIFHRFREPV